MRQNPAVFRASGVLRNGIVHLFRWTWYLYDDPSIPGLSPEEHRLQAVMALFRGEKASDVSTTFGICRSDLYKFRTRALAAMREALEDHHRGPKRPYNRLSDEREQQVIALYQRHPNPRHDFLAHCHF